MSIKEWFLRDIDSQLKEILKEIKKMATTQAQYDAILTQLASVVTDEDSTIATALTTIDALLAQIASGTAPADLTTEATQAQAMIADIQTQTASLAAEVAKVTPTPPTSPVKGS